ncbi:SAM-dependent methyltransferase [Aporhodopirellula aestuarii]|uniref:Class I SAM-dependent methyltransferase n=1 Tax=Aporhodopirellula aestuarii TaxID=2950107 RepID=A0ABT0UDJ6_9BACT|nr:class I SAM-dependent methyltransferase [Aporhodopirellula aestuarii]MCM2374453.1 class I SAM-dependent methyltransferase [Aporhodopirellula aestuarii]
MVDKPVNPPYFDGLFERLAKHDASTVAAFSRHVHWGYWKDPSQATCSPEDYGTAAENLCRVVCDAAPIRDGMRIVDVGCGFGGTLASLNDRYSGLQLVGVNIDPRQLERAAELVRPKHGNSIEFVHADAARIPLPDKCFDVVLAVECVFHFDRPRFFAETERLLDQGGTLTLSDFVPSERSLEYLDKIDLSANEAIRWSYGEIDLSYSISRYQELAKAHGLVLRESIDITENTLPTYEFLYASTADWTDTWHVELFTRATRLLEKGSRNKMIGYEVLRFVCS